MKNIVLFSVVIALLVTSALVLWRFNSAIQRARAQALQGSTLVQTRCGQIEYQQAGTGTPLLAIHGSGGGHDLGMAFARGLATQGISVFAMSRFGTFWHGVLHKGTSNFEFC